MQRIENRIYTAIKEAHRFLARAEAWEKRIDEEGLGALSGSKEGGACKRSSLDLTRALANLRKGNGN